MGVPVKSYVAFRSTEHRAAARPTRPRRHRTGAPGCPRHCLYARMGRTAWGHRVVEGARAAGGGGNGPCPLHLLGFSASDSVYRQVFDPCGKKGFAKNSLRFLIKKRYFFVNCQPKRRVPRGAPAPQPQTPPRARAAHALL